MLHGGVMQHAAGLCEELTKTSELGQLDGIHQHGDDHLSLVTG